MPLGGRHPVRLADSIRLAGHTGFALNTLPMSTDKDSQTANPRRSAHVDPKLLEILVCPVTRQTLEYDREAGELISRAAGLAYPVREGVPVMLPEEARRIDG